MNRPAADSPAFWPTVLLLLRFARKRSTGRQKRRAELQRNRAGKFVADWGGFGFVVLALGTAGAEGPASGPSASATAWAVKVNVPSGTAASTQAALAAWSSRATPTSPTPR